MYVVNYCASIIHPILINHCVFTGTSSIIPASNIKKEKDTVTIKQEPIEIAETRKKHGKKGNWKK